jgi:DNA-binding IclR family transcriptional regulator
MLTARGRFRFQFAYKNWCTMMQSSKESTVKSADRVLDLLELLCSTGHPMTHTEISSALSIPKSSMSQLLGNLERRGYLSFRAGPNVYELGPAVSRLAEGSKSSSDFLDIVRNVVDVIAKTTRETASFYKRRGNRVERVIVANSLRPLRYWMQVGESMPLHATSGGKAILASMQQNQLDKILARMRLTKVTANTIISHTAIREELAATAKTGIAHSREEFEEGVIGISVAVLKRDNQPEGSLSVVFPTVRDKPAHRKVIVEALHTGKARLEAEIGRSSTAPTRSRSGKSRT